VKCEEENAVKWKIIQKLEQQQKNDHNIKISRRSIVYIIDISEKEDFQRLKLSHKLFKKNFQKGMMCVSRLKRNPNAQTTHYKIPAH
jgi:hypothetical protein